MIVKGCVCSEVLGMDTGISIVTPNGAPPVGGYRVAYLLHGLFGNNETWLNHSMLPTYAADGKTVYILPEVGRSFYADMRHGPQYFTYVTEELPAICKRLFRLSEKREDTAVLGGSMGGFGALKCALAHPERYGMCGAFASSNLLMREEMDAQREHGTEEAFRQNYGELLACDIYNTFGKTFICPQGEDVWMLMRGLLTENGDAKEPLPVVYAACGQQDGFVDSHRRFFGAMQKTVFPCTYEEWPAAHEFPFFNEALRRAIQKFGL